MGGNNIAKYRHEQIARLVLEGLSAKEIAEVMNLNPNSVSRILGRPDVLEMIDNLRNGINEKHSNEMTKGAGDIREQIAMLVPKALETQARLLSCGSHSVERQAASDLLDRGGYKADEVVKASMQLSLPDNLAAMFRMVKEDREKEKESVNPTDTE